MQYHKTVPLKDGRTCVLRNAVAGDAKGVLENFILTHTETQFLSTYPEEIRFTEEQEAELMQRKTDSADAIELVAEVDGRIVGLSGIDPVSRIIKARHRANFGISVEKAHWGLGIGKALTEACIECAKEAGYTQIELDVVADNEKAIALYKSKGFVEYGRNPQGFNSRINGMQELVLMRLDLED